MRGQKGLTAATVAGAHNDRSVAATTTGDEIEGGRRQPSSSMTPGRPPWEEPARVGCHDSVGRATVGRPP